MPAANHSYYLRNCYLENNLTKGKMTIDGVGIDLGKVKIADLQPRHHEKTTSRRRNRSIVGSSFFGGPMRYVLSGSGHIAGVVNPPAKKKYQYWTGDTPHGDDVDAWLERRRPSIRARGGPTGSPGSRRRTPPRSRRARPAAACLEPIEDAPGSYVKVRS